MTGLRDGWEMAPGYSADAITAYGGCCDMTCGCIPARAYCAGRAAERDTIRQLATEHNAQCNHTDGSGGPFADLLGGGQ